VYNPANPYHRRDPRIYSIVVLNGRPLSYGLTNSRPIESFVVGLDGLGKFRSTTTGSYMRKYVNNGLDLKMGQDSWHSWVLFGMNELYLNYAEAFFQGCPTPSSTVATDGTTHPKSALALVNELRTKGKVSSRVNLYAYPVSTTRDAFAQILRKERQIELAFEGHRFFDIRRWRLMDDPVQREAILTIRAMKITRNENNVLTYDANEVVEKRVWDDKMYLYPIPHSEVMRSGGLIKQNEGW